MSNPIGDGIKLAMKPTKPTENKSPGRTFAFTVFTVLTFALLLQSWQENKELREKYAVLAETAVASHDGQVAMEAMMNSKASSDTAKIREAIEIVYNGKMPQQEK